jgi:hypothetical protein
MSNLLRTISFLFFIGAQASWADMCPTPSTSIDPRLEAKVTFDKKTNQYLYSYSISNGSDAKTAIERFRIEMSTNPQASTSPNKWFPRYLANHNIPTLNWSTTYINLGAKGLGGGLPVAAYAVRPGQKLSGFSFKSPLPPGAARFLADGFYQPPTTTPTVTDDEPAPNCPGIDLVNEVDDTMVTGLTVGPLPPDTISPKMRLRDETGEHKCGPIDPSQASGNVTLLILSSSTFDASQINVSSVRFGPAQVAPLRSEVISSKEDDDRDDEREEWERMSEHSDKNTDHKKDSKLKNLLLTFDLKSLDVQCVLDRALFFSASTNSGQKVIGGVSAHTVGCNVRRPGVHAHHKKHERFGSARKPGHKSGNRGED